jgi:hypothetical protein
VSRQYVVADADASTKASNSRCSAIQRYRIGDGAV